MNHVLETEGNLSMRARGYLDATQQILARTRPNLCLNIKPMLHHLLMFLFHTQTRKTTRTKALCDEMSNLCMKSVCECCERKRRSVCGVNTQIRHEQRDMTMQPSLSHHCLQRSHGRNRFRSTCGGRLQGRSRRTPPWRSTSAGTSTATQGWTHRSTPSTCAQAERQS